MSVLTSMLNDGILTLTLNRPDKLNALNDEILHALSEAFHAAKTDSSVKALLITGTGKAFCAGADIQRLSECNAEQGYAFACLGQNVFRHLETMGKPSIAAINGYALGGGCELAMAATLRIASDNAQFAQPEIKLGVIPGYGGTQRLTRLIGKGRALDLCLTGRTINAETALQFGLINECVAPAALIPTAIERLNLLIKLPPLAIAGIISAIDYGMNLPLTEALHLEALHFSKLCASHDKHEGVTAFLEKRAAVFTGA